jgi:Gluconate 2-dehydrogenase subunit 3
MEDRESRGFDPRELERRVFLKAAGLGVLAFAVEGGTMLMTAAQARAQGVPFRLLQAHEAETIEALGETLVPGARQAGIAHFIDQQVSVPPGDALLEARTVNVRPPYVNFYRAALAGIDKACQSRFGHPFAAAAPVDQVALVDLLRQSKIEDWAGPPAGLVYFVLRSDAADVVFGTMDGYEALGMPYQPHIAPELRW